MRIDEGRSVNPGLLRHQVVWQRKSVSGQDGFGQDIFTWAQIVVCRCQIKELEGQELEAALQLFSEAKFVIMQHFYRGLKTSDRGQWFIDGTHLYLDIIGLPDPVGTRLYQMVYAKEWLQ